MKTNVGVLFGGRSVEHEISVVSALQVIKALDREQFVVTPIYISKQGAWYSGEELACMSNYKDIPKLLKRCKKIYLSGEYGDYKLYKKSSSIFSSKVYASLDVMIPVLHGTNGEDGITQGLLDLVGIPYVGCNVLSSALGMDKIAMKMMIKESGIPTVDYCWFTDREWFDRRGETLSRIEELGYPLIVKPSNLGSSVGISKALNREELFNAISVADKFSNRILVEKMISNLKEVNCSVLGDCDNMQASVCEEPVRSGEILSYTDKYMSSTDGPSQGMQSTVRIMPAQIPDSLTNEIQHLAKETFRILSCNGVSRIDFLYDNDAQKVYVNEINTIPGSLSSYLWKATGVEFSELMNRLVALAIDRKRKSGMKTISYSENIFTLDGSAGGSKFGSGSKFSDTNDSTTPTKRFNSEETFDKTLKNKITRL